jgi:hypothetical protein
MALSKERCGEEARKAVESMMEHDSWLVAVFHVEGDGVKMHRVTCNFPTGRFDSAVNLLSANLRQEIVDPDIGDRPIKPLPIVRLFDREPGTPEPEPPKND